jgi:DNA polymerase I-like protein with 3'-5' exonuclease and polymerase domains
MRMVSKGKPSPDQLPLFTPESNWQIPAELPDLSRETEVAIDTETKDTFLAKDMGPGFYQYERTNANTGYICGISAAWRDQAIYIPLRHPESKCFDYNLVQRWLKALAAQRHTRFVFHSFQYDWGWLEAAFGVPPPALVDDVVAMTSMIDENQFSFSLDDLCRWQRIPGKDEAMLKLAAIDYNIPVNKIKPNLWRLPSKFVGPYAEQDASSTLGLAQKLRPLLTAEYLDEPYQIERDLLPITLKMKQRGVKVNVERAKNIAKAILESCQQRLDQLSEEIGQKVTIKEIRQTEWLSDQFKRRGIFIYKTPMGNPSFSKEVMAGYSEEFPKFIHKIKHDTELAEKFLRGYICDYAHNGRVYPTINQFRSESGGTRSHRFSYSDPPLQQTPSRDDEWASIIRSCFEAEADETWCSIDYRQQEYRLIVYVAEKLRARGAKQAADRYRTDPDTDFHDYVASITHLPRRRAKDVNFAVSYGAGIKKFALMTGMNENEAEATLKQYNEQLPFVRQSYNEYQWMATRDGYIELIDGARNHFNLHEPADFRDFTAVKRYQEMYPDEKIETFSCPYEEAARRTQNDHHPWFGHKLRRSFTHKAFNRMIQGSAARQIKKAMVLAYQAGYMPILQVHDELCFSLADPAQAKVCAEIMEHAIPSITIPMLTDIKLGKSWGELKKLLL